VSTILFLRCASALSEVEKWALAMLWRTEGFDRDPHRIGDRDIDVGHGVLLLGVCQVSTGSEVTSQASYENDGVAALAIMMSSSTRVDGLTPVLAELTPVRHPFGQRRALARSGLVHGRPEARTSYSSHHLPLGDTLPTLDAVEHRCMSEFSGSGDLDRSSDLPSGSLERARRLVQDCSPVVSVARCGIASHPSTPRILGGVSADVLAQRSDSTFDEQTRQVQRVPNASQRPGGGLGVCSECGSSRVRTTSTRGIVFVFVFVSEADRGLSMNIPSGTRNRASPARTRTTGLARGAERARAQSR
jgi:hypothetical protein